MYWLFATNVLIYNTVDLTINFIMLVYTIMKENSDVEWKFARSRVWMMYFDTTSVLPHPLCLFPDVQDIMNIIEWFKVKIKKPDDKKAKWSTQVSRSKNIPNIFACTKCCNLANRFNYKNIQINRLYGSHTSQFPSITRRWHKVDLMLGHPLQHWLSIKSTLDQHLVSAGSHFYN